MDSGYFRDTLYDYFACRHFNKLIRKGVFVSSEPEFFLINKLVGEGDCAVDVGANIGRYTLALSRAAKKKWKSFCFRT